MVTTLSSEISNKTSRGDFQPFYAVSDNDYPVVNGGLFTTVAQMVTFLLVSIVVSVLFRLDRHRICIEVLELLYPLRQRAVGTVCISCTVFLPIYE